MTDGGGLGRGVAEDEAGVSGVLGVPRQRLGLDAVFEGAGGQFGVALDREPAGGAGREGDHEVEARGCAVDDGVRQVGAHGGDHRVAAGTVASADEAQVAFEGAAFHQAGQYELREGGVTEVGEAFGVDEVLAVGGGGEEPADAQGGCEEFGNTADVADVLGGHGAQGGYGGVVIAVFGVVVVLDDESAFAGPVHQGAAPLAAEDHSGGELVGGGEQYGGDAGGAERLDADAVGVDGHGRGFQVPVAQVLAGAEGAGVLDGELVDAVGVEHFGEEAEGLGGAGDDQDVVGVGGDAAVEAEPAGYGAAQCGGAAGVAVSEVAGGEFGQNGAFGAQPGGAGEGGEVGQARRQVDAGGRGPVGVEGVEPVGAVEDTARVTM